MKWVVLCVLAVSLSSAGALANAPQFDSLAPEFDLFIAQAKGKSLDKQMEIWTETIEKRYPEIYLQVIAGGDFLQMEEKLKERATKTFPFLIANADDIRKQFQLFETEGRAVIESLVRQYPHADMSKVKVIAMPSLDKFNGKVMAGPDSIYVLFGVDMLVHIKENPELVPGAYLMDDLPVTMAHEFTHALQDVLSKSHDEDIAAEFFSNIWDEGLGQVNSQLLVAGTNLTSVYMERNLALACTVGNISRWAEQFIEDSKGSKEELRTAYNRWFTLSSGLQEHGVYRAGYCLGYNVILKALREHSMKELIAMDRNTAVKFTREVLGEFAEGRSK